MKFTINRAAFIKELNTVQRAISSKTTIPILTGLKLVADDSGLTLTGSDADISIETLIHADNPPGCSQRRLKSSKPGMVAAIWSRISE